ncbi:MAG TPA: hypothetical protein VGJ91_23420 [Polyangiaceae bacterium]
MTMTSGRIASVADVTPTCSECTSPATHGAYCVYCSNETEGGCGERDHIDMVTAQQMRKGQMSDGSPIPRELAARARLAAWERAERPRGNSKNAIEMAKPHPWECEDV